MASILLTGFEPFGDRKRNPSAEIAQMLDECPIAGHVVQAEVLPCVFGESLRRLCDAIDRVAPILVVCLGVDGNRHEIHPERVAINLDDARIPDNEGHQPIDRPVVPGGPAAYFSGLPVKSIVDSLRAEGIPAGISDSAGTYVCNHVFYGLMHFLAARSEIRGGFIHIPFDSIRFPMTTIRRGIALAMEKTLSADEHPVREEPQAHSPGSVITKPPRHSPPKDGIR